MTTQLNQIKDRWQQFSLREKRFILTGIFIVTVLLCYTFIWAPLTNRIAFLQNKIQHDKQLLNWMQKADQHLSSLKNAAHKKDNRSIFSMVQNQLQRSSFAAQVGSLRLINDNAVQLSLHAVSFDKLIVWLIQLSDHERLQVSLITVNATEAAGLVNADLTLI